MVACIPSPVNEPASTCTHQIHNITFNVRARSPRSSGLGSTPVTVALSVVPPYVRAHLHGTHRRSRSTKHQTPRTKSEDEARSSGRYLVFDTRCSMLDRHRAQRQARPTRLLSGRRSSAAKVHHPIMLRPRPDLGVRVGSIHIQSDILPRPRRASPGLLEAGDACACSVVQLRSPRVQWSMPVGVESCCAVGALTPALQ